MDQQIQKINSFIHNHFEGEDYKTILKHLQHEMKNSADMSFIQSNLISPFAHIKAHNPDYKFDSDLLFKSDFQQDFGSITQFIEFIYSQLQPLSVASHS